MSVSLLTNFLALGGGIALGAVNIDARENWTKFQNEGKITLFNGQVTGESANVMGGLAAALITLSGIVLMGVLWWWYLKRNNRIKETGFPERYSKIMSYFWMFMTLSAVTGIVLGALNLELNNNYSELKVEEIDGRLRGSYGDALFGMSIAQISVSGLAFLLYMYGEFSVGPGKGKMIINEGDGVLKV